MKVTIKDIAEMAGVSKSTVSRYLNEGYVSEENREKISEAIEKTGYKTNFFAKRLKSKRSHLIGVIVPRLDSFTATKTLKGISEQLERVDYEMFISITNLNIDREIEYIKKFYLQGVDGIIVSSSIITEKHYEIVKGLPIPVLFVGQEDDRLNCISIDDRLAGYLLGEYIRNQGHRDIVYLGVNEKDKAVGFERKSGFMEAFNEDYHNINFVETDFFFQNAYKKAEKVMEYNPSAIVCATDNIAIGVIRYLSENDYKIPEEVSIAGFGGYDIGTAIHPPLTTVAIDYRGLGKKAAKSILNLIDDEKLEEEYNIGLKLIKRESVREL